MDSRLCIFLLTGAVHATSTVGYATVHEDFQFNDPAGTLLADVANSASPGNQWYEDTTDMPPSQVQGGVYRINKANLGLGNNFLDIDDITTGVRWMVMDIAGWNLIPDNPNELEDLALSFLDNPTIPGGSTRTADISFTLISPGVFRLQGTALGTGSSFTGFIDFGNSHTTPLSVALKLDKDTNTFELLYKDNTDPWSTLGTGNIGDKLLGPVTEKRDGNTVRFRANNDFGAVGECFDVDRIYITDVDPTPEPASAVLLGIAGLALMRRVS